MAAADREGDADAPVDLRALGGRELVAAVGELSGDELTAAVHRMGTAAALDRIFSEMPRRFRTSRAAGVEGTIQFLIGDDGATHAYACTVGEDSCTTVRGEATAPRATLRTDLVAFLRLITGHASGPSLLLRGRVSLDGDLRFAAGFPGLFETPEA